MSVAVAASMWTLIGPASQPASASGVETYSLEMLTPRTDAADEISYALDITTDTNGVIYISESTGRIFRIENGIYELVHGYPGQTIADQAMWPSSVITDPAGNLYFSDRQKHRVQKLTASGVLSTIAGTGVAGSGAGQLHTPMELDFDLAGNLYINDAGNDRIMMLDSGGILSLIVDLTTVSGGLSEFFNEGAIALAVANDGSIYFCDQSYEYKFANGNFEIQTDTSFGSCTNIGFDANGRRYVLSRSPTPVLWVEGGITDEFDIPTEPENSSSLHIRPNGTIDVISGWAQYTQQYTVQRGLPREQISNTVDSGAPYYNPRTISRSPNGTVLLTDLTEQPIREFTSEDNLVPVSTDDFKVDFFAAGDNGSFLIGPKPNHPDPVPIWISKLSEDGTVTPIVRALKDSKGIYEAPDGTAWVAKFKTATQANRPTLLRYTGSSSENIWDELTKPPGSNTAQGVVFATDGTSYIGDIVNDTTYRRSPNGDTIVYNNDGRSRPLDLDPNGRLLVLSNTGALRWIETDGTSTSVGVSGGMTNYIVDAVVTDDGKRILILVDDGLTYRLGRLTSPSYVPPPTTATTTTAPPTTTTTATTTTTTTPAACSRRITAVRPTTDAESLSARLYIAYFLRQPDLGGYRYWADQLAVGANARDLSWGFANSTEFVNTYSTLTNRQFVTLAYGNVMCRTPDQAGYDYWLNLLDNGTITRSDMMLNFAGSTEFRNLTGT